MSNVIWTRTSPQKEFMQLDCKFPAFVAGFGCVHPHTKIWTDEGLTRICDLKPLTRVLSWNEKNQQFQLSLSGGGYPKGKANLFRVSTPRGKFDATAHHHVFSSDCKYQSVQTLRAGDAVKTASQHLLSTISGLDLLSSALDVQRYSRTDEDCLVRYVTEARLYGLQLLNEEDIGPEYLPLLGDAHKSNQCGGPLTSERLGVLAERQLKHIRHGRSSYLHSKSRLGSHSQSQSCAEGGHALTLHLEHTCENHHKELQSLLKTSPRHSKWKHSFDVHSFENPIVDSGILSIQDTGEEVYWDMQVLGTNNYVTECGVIHHNTGKSEVMCQSAICDAIEGGSKSLVAMYEPTYDLVRLILAPRMEDKLQEAGIAYKYNKSENIIYTSTTGIGDFVLRTLDNPSRIVGYESFRAKIDELDTLKKEHAKEAWIKIIARNRQKPSTYKPVTNKPCNTVSVFTTPEGFRFVYDKWKKNPVDGYQMVQASTMSNPFLPDDYVEALRASYPSNLIEAYLNGDFVNLSGGQVYRQFDRRLNHSDETENGSETIHIGLDFNVGKMSAVVHVERDGLPVAVDELFGALDTPDMIQQIQMKYPNRNICIYPDSSGKNRKSNEASTTDITCLEDAGFKLYYESVNPRVRDRINAVNAMLCNGQDERKYKINTNKCPRYTDDLEQQVYNKQGEPDKAHDNDHMPDAGGYYIAYAFPIIKPIVKQDFRWRR